MKFKVGDLCITQNAKVPFLNNNALVVIVGIDPTFTCVKGEAAPYYIRRVDGQPHPSTRNSAGKLDWYKCFVVSCPEYKLRLAATPNPVVEEEIKNILVEVA